ncbi:DUF2267 domain-containing protein [Nocardia pneumoniae]|uniref:DUF2267 domain-containing protein n=1 Tax=Nocardia pneumoniae TaxID=228601 RepID=UPI0007C84294|nr:DUF2267 domain-containing protein [Nocardia pneumoniae]
MSPKSDPLAASVYNAHEWLNAVAGRIGTEDSDFAHRVMRAWLHAVRDRIGVVGSAHLTAQLPEILRGIYYEGWVPSHTPVGHRVGPFLDQFANEAGVTRDEVPRLAGAVTDTLIDRFSPGQLDRVFAVLPERLRAVLHGETGGETADRIAAAESVTDRIDELEHRLLLLGDAIAVLTRGLEQLPIGDTGDERRTTAAQQAHRILMAEHLTTTSSEQPQ